MPESSDRLPLILRLLLQKLRDGKQATFDQLWRFAQILDRALAIRVNDLIPVDLLFQHIHSVKIWLLKRHEIVHLNTGSIDFLGEGDLPQ